MEFAYYIIEIMQVYTKKNMRNCKELNFPENEFSAAIYQIH